MTPPSKSRRGRGHRDTSDPFAMRFRAPPHPVSELQGPFEESMAEAAGWEESEVPSDAASRRTLLLDAPTYERVIAGRWKQKQGERYHPLWKLVAQLSFGVHLLAEGLAKSEDDVMQILQTHIDDIDLFLERTTEDLTLAQEDIQERLRCLQLPLQHPKVFDRMLEDKAFRTSIVDGNEKIEHIVARTGCAMKDALKDAQKGLDATGALERYMAGLEDTWMRQNAEQDAVYLAMLENVEGWRQAFINLYTQGDTLGALLKQLADVINQMQQRAGEVSRRLARAQQKQGHVSIGSNSITYVAAHQSTSSLGGSRTGTPERSSRKPLPGVPHRGAPAASTNTTQTHYPSAPRPPTNQSHRPETAQSNRSASSHLPADLRNLRNPSRERLQSSGRDSQLSNTSSRAPRLVEIKRNSPLNIPHLTPTLLKEGSTRNSSNELPVELSAEHSRSSTRTLSASSLKGMNVGLAIVPGKPKSTTDARTQSSTPTLLGQASDPASIGRLPLTPNSISSHAGTNSASVHELDSQSPASRIQAPTLPFVSDDNKSQFGSPPATPAWAKQTFELEGHHRAVSGKTAFHSHPPHAELGSPPILLPRTAYVQPQRNPQTQPATPKIGGAGSEVAASDRASSVRSESVPGANVETPSAKLPESIVGTDKAGLSEAQPVTKVFAAELEGSTPIMLRSAVFKGIAAELEAPQGNSLLQPRISAPSTPSALSSRASASSHDDHAGGTSELSTLAAASELSAVETQVAAAVRRSFIATNIELPGEPLEGIASNIVQPGCQESGAQQQSIQVASSPDVRPHEDSSMGQDNSSGGVSAKQKDDPFRPVRLENLNQRYIASAQRSPALRKPVSAGSSPVTAEPASASAATPLQRPEKPGRLSTASSASSQSQWRAFFKGQLSPAEYTTSSPTLTTGNLSLSSKVTLDGHKRGQMISPTLGWQWAPVTPDTEDTSRVVSA